MKTTAAALTLSLLLLTSFLLVGSAGAFDDEPIFSGPQVGEKVSPFTVRGVLDEEDGKDYDYVASADGKPLFLIFVHEVTRPSAGLTRTLMDYAATRTGEGLTAGTVFLYDDMTAGANRIKVARHALPTDTRIGISVDGQEGPGAYGLNRRVALTVLIANENRVTANFAIVQPSIQADTPKVLAELVKVIGGEAPTLEQLGAGDYGKPKMMRARQPSRGAAPAAAAPDTDLRELISPLIRKTATEEEVDKAAKAILEYVEKHEAAKKQIGDIARRIISAGKLENYGTPAAQEYLRSWAKGFGAEASSGAQKSRP